MMAAHKILGLTSYQNTMRSASGKHIMEKELILLTFTLHLLQQRNSLSDTHQAPDIRGQVGTPPPDPGTRACMHGPFANVTNETPGGSPFHPLLCVSSQKGRLLIMTTNHIERLDDALIRPGRVDRKVLFQLADEKMSSRLFCTVFKRSNEDDSNPEKKTDDETIDRLASAAKVPDHLCSQRVIHRGSLADLTHSWVSVLCLYNGKFDMNGQSGRPSGVLSDVMLTYARRTLRPLSNITPVDHYARRTLRPSTITPVVEHYARRTLRPSNITPVEHYARRRTLRPSSNITPVDHYAR
ncbi:hypothetical protein RJZ57_006673 [Blastomyces gilchristii]